MYFMIRFPSFSFVHTSAPKNIILVYDAIHFQGVYWFSPRLCHICVVYVVSYSLNLGNSNFNYYMKSHYFLDWILVSEI